MKIVFSSFCDVRAGLKEVRHGLLGEGAVGSFPLLVNIPHDIVELLWQEDVLAVDGLIEHRRNLFFREPGNAASNLRHKEFILRMLLRKLNKLIHVGLDGFHAALHRGNGIAPALQPDALPHHGTEFSPGHIGRPATMAAGQIAAEHEYLVRPKFRNEIRRILRPGDVMVGSHLAGVL